MLETLSIEVALRLVVLLSLLSLICKYVKTKKYINRLPVLTRRKYLGLSSFALKGIVVCTILFIFLLMTSNILAIGLIFGVIMIVAYYIMTELNILKEYVNDKRRKR